MNMSAPLLKNSYLQREINAQKSRLCYHSHFSIHTNVKSILWSYQCAVIYDGKNVIVIIISTVLLLIIILIIIVVILTTVKAAIVTVIVNIDIIILFFGIAILGGYNSDFAGEMPSNFGFAYLVFAFSHKLHSSLLNFLLTSQQ